jgi:phage tail-like protein
MPTTTTEREDPLTGFHFAVEVQGIITGYFTECSGIGSETEVIEHKVINDKGVASVMKIPGRLKWGDVTLKRGVTSAMDIWQWRKMVEDGKIADARKNGSIVAYDQTLTEVARWNFENGWPSKVDGPAPKSDADENMVEELTITHEYITRIA